MKSQRQQAGIILPLYPKSFQDLKRMAIAEPITRTCLHKLNSEIFRRPIEIKPKFWGKCDQCNYRFKQKPASIIIDKFEMLRNGVPDCPVCTTGTIRPPDPMQEQELEYFKDNANFNDRRLIEVCEQLEYDMNTLDDYYLIQFKDYMKHKEDGKVIGQTKAVVRGDPELMRISADERQNIGVVHWTCFDHRDQIFDEPEAACQAGKHPWDLPLLPVWYVATEFGGKAAEICYIRKEVIHGNKYFRNPLYGMPSMITLYRTQFLHIMMIDYMYMYYKEKKIPSGMLAMPETDQESLDEEVDKWHAKMNENPNYIPVFAIDPEAKSKPEFIRFFDKLTEMELQELRKEIKEVIGAYFGVMPVLLADTSSGGGLNNEGLQFTVTTRAVEYSQNEFNHHIFPRLLEGLMITDWKLELPPSEEQDSMAILQRQAQTLLNIQTALDVGLDVEIIPHEEENIEARYSGKPQKLSMLGDALNSLWDEGKKPANNEDSKTKAKGPEPQQNTPSQGTPPAPKDSSKNKDTANAITKSKQEIIPLIENPISDIAKLGFEDFSKRTIQNRGQLTEKMVRKLVSFSDKARGALELDWVQGMVSMLSGFILSQVVVHIPDRKPGKTPLEEKQLRKDEKDLILKSIGNLDEVMFARFSELSQDFFREIYSMGIISIEKEIKVNLDLSMGSEEVIQAFMSQEPFQTALKGLSKDTSLKMREMVIEGYKEGRRPTRQELKQKFRKVVSLEEPRLNTIARTESQRFFLIGRETGYEKIEQARGEEFKYVWRVRHDNRTSDLCKAIERKVPSDGLSLEELKTLVFETPSDIDPKTGKPFMPSYWKRSWTPHPNCRSRMIRKVL